LCIALTEHFFARGSSPVRTEEKHLNFNFFFGAKKDLEDLSAYAGGVAEWRRYVGSVGLPPSLKKGIFSIVSPVLVC
jgi:hypothetical protein